MASFGRRRLITAAAAAGFRSARAQGLPRDIDFLIPFGPGGGFDGVVRAAAPAMALALGPGSRVTPHNIEGDGGARVATRLAQAPADGGTIAVLNMPGALILQMVTGNAGFDLARFTWLGTLGADPYALCVGMNSPVASLEALRALSQRRELSFASTGTASTAHAATLIAARLLGLSGQVQARYRGSNDTLLGLAQGECDAAVVSLPSVRAMAAAGLVRVIASFETTSSLPGLPDATRLGQPELAALVQYRPVAAPPGLDAARRAGLAAALASALAGPGLRAWARSRGARLVPATPEETRMLLTRQIAFIAKWRDVLAAEG